jgi:hypothetical protein
MEDNLAISKNLSCVDLPYFRLSRPAFFIRPDIERFVATAQSLACNASESVRRGFAEPGRLEKVVADDDGAKLSR